MVSNKRPNPHRHPPPRPCAWTQLLKVPASQLSPGPDWGRRVMLDGCWKLRLLWEQEGWVPVGGVMGEGGGGGQAVSAIGSDGKGWSRGGAQTPNPRLCDSRTSGCLLSGPALYSSFLPWSSPPPLLTSFSSPWPLFQAPMSPTPSVPGASPGRAVNPAGLIPSSLAGEGPRSPEPGVLRSRARLGTQRPGAA